MWTSCFLLKCRSLVGKTLLYIIQCIYLSDGPCVWAINIYQHLSTFTSKNQQIIPLYTLIYHTWNIWWFLEGDRLPHFPADSGPAKCGRATSHRQAIIVYLNVEAEKKLIEVLNGLGVVHFFPHRAR